MKSPNTYIEAMQKKDTETTKEIIEYLENGKKYEEYAPFAYFGIKERIYKAKEYLSLYGAIDQETATKLNEIDSSPTQKEKKETEKQNQIKKEQQRILQRQKNAGITNATILIYVAVNLGLFLAVLLLIIK